MTKLKPRFKRVLLKLSGEILASDKGFGIEPGIIQRLAQEIKSVHDHGVEVGVVIGGGNIFRGIQSTAQGFDRVSGDHMGMLATAINGLALQDVLEQLGVFTRVLSAIEMRAIAEPYIRRKAVRHLEKGRIVIFACGIGSPYFTTDTSAALRALEIDAQAVLKGTKVDGVYDKDPVKHPDAVMFNHVSFQDVLKQGLKVMDAAAISLCMDNHLPIVVFNIGEPGNLAKVVLCDEVEELGEHIHEQAGDGGNKRIFRSVPIGTIVS